MAVKIEKTDKQTRFVTGTEAAFHQDTAAFANDAYMCTDSGKLYICGKLVTDKARVTPVLWDSQELNYCTGIGGEQKAIEYFVYITVGEFRTYEPQHILIRGYYYDDDYKDGRQGPFMPNAISTGYKYFDKLTVYYHGGLMWIHFPKPTHDIAGNIEITYGSRSRSPEDSHYIAPSYEYGAIPSDAAKKKDIQIEHTAMESTVTANAMVRIELNASTQLPKDVQGAYMAAIEAAESGRRLVLTVSSGTGLYGAITAASVMSTGDMAMVDALMNGKARRLTITTASGEPTASWADL